MYKKIMKWGSMVCLCMFISGLQATAYKPENEDDYKGTPLPSPEPVTQYASQYTSMLQKISDEDDDNEIVEQKPNWSRQSSINNNDAQIIEETEETNKPSNQIGDNDINDDEAKFQMLQRINHRMSNMNIRPIDLHGFVPKKKRKIIKKQIRHRIGLKMAAIRQDFLCNNAKINMYQYFLRNINKELTNSVDNNTLLTQYVDFIEIENYLNSKIFNFSSSAKIPDEKLKILKNEEGKNIDYDFAEITIRGLFNYKIWMDILHSEKYSFIFRLKAGEALAEFGCIDIKNIFIKFIKNKKRNPVNKQLCIKALNKVFYRTKNKDVYNTLVEIAKDKSETDYVRDEAMRGLCRIDKEKGLKILVEIAKDKSEYISTKKDAIAYIGVFGGKDEIPILLYLYKNTSIIYTLQINRALKKLGYKWEWSDYLPFNLPSPQKIEEIKKVAKDVAKDTTIVGTIGTTLGPGAAAAAYTGIKAGNEVIDAIKNTQTYKNAKQKVAMADPSMPDKPELTTAEELAMWIVKKLDRTYAYKWFCASVGVGVYYLSIPYAAVFPRSSLFIVGSAGSSYVVAKSLGINRWTILLEVAIMCGLAYVLFNDYLPQYAQQNDVKVIVKEVVKAVKKEAKEAPIKLRNAPKHEEPRKTTNPLAIILFILAALGILGIVFKAR